MTQVQLAHQADVSPTHVSELENAGTAPGIDLGEPVPLFLLKEQATRMLNTLLEKGNNRYCHSYIPGKTVIRVGKTANRNGETVMEPVHDT
jgi:hypothetical protein